MWSDAGGGGFNTSFGGDDGAGYGTQQFASPGPDVKRSQGRRIERIIPLTIRSVVDLDENNQEYCGNQVGMVMVMGLIREVEVTSTKVTYTLDDTTATIKAVKWLDSEVEEEPLMENTYCRVHGTFKTHQGNKQLLAVHLEPITNFNWVTAHILEVVHSVLQLKRLQNEASSTGIGKSDGAMMGGDGSMGVGQSGAMSNSLVGYGGMGSSSSGMGSGGTGPLTKQQKMVFEVIRAASSENDDSGCSRDQVKGRLKGQVTPQQVDDSLFYLSNEGHIYTTLDEDHFKATDG